MRRLFVLLIVLMTGAARAEAPVFTLAVGKVDATAQESDECYFHVGFSAETAMVSFPPRADACNRMRELKGATIKLQAVVEQR